MTLPTGIDDFAGLWQLDRRIEDALAGRVLRATGTAELVRDDTGWHWREDLDLTVPGQAPMKAVRRYLWRPGPDRIAVCFDDGRYFHEIRLGGAEARDRHDCPPDDYRVFYEFARWPDWSARWQVTGPKKSYVMDTEIRRPSAG